MHQNIWYKYNQHIHEATNSEIRILLKRIISMAAITYLSPFSFEKTTLYDKDIEILGCNTSHGMQ
jgi:hypothetical protein